MEGQFTPYHWDLLHRVLLNRVGSSESWFKQAAQQVTVPDIPPDISEQQARYKLISDQLYNILQNITTIDQLKGLKIKITDQGITQAADDESSESPPINFIQNSKALDSWLQKFGDDGFLDLLKASFNPDLEQRPIFVAPDPRALGQVYSTNSKLDYIGMRLRFEPADPEDTSIQPFEGVIIDLLDPAHAPIGFFADIVEHVFKNWGIKYHRNGPTYFTRLDQYGNDTGKAVRSLPRFVMYLIPQSEPRQLDNKPSSSQLSRRELLQMKKVR